MQLFQGCSWGQVTSYGHGHFLSRRRALKSPRAQSEPVASGSRRFCSITAAPGVGPGRRSAPSQTSGSLLRDAPAPHPASRAAAPPGTPTRARRAAPSPWKFPRRPGTAILPPAPPPLPPGPSLPTAPGEEKNSLSSVNTAELCSLPLRPDFADKRPGIGGNQGPLPPPHAKLPSPTRSDPRRSAEARAPLSRPCSLEIEVNNKKQHPPLAPIYKFLSVAETA